MKRPSYAEAVYWIALNDSAGDNDDQDGVAGYISTALVADLWGLDQNEVAGDVIVERMKVGLGTGAPF